MKKNFGMFLYFFISDRSTAILWANFQINDKKGKKQNWKLQFCLSPYFVYHIKLI